MPSLPYPVSAHVSKWTEDEFTKGCYTYISCQSSVQDIVNLAEPLYHTSHNGDLLPRVLFAGEATSTAQYATMNGAFESGVREAKRIIELVEKF